MAKKAKEDRLLSRVRKEMKEVKWPKAKEVLKYTLATVVLCGIFIGFFLLINMISASLLPLVRGIF